MPKGLYFTAVGFFFLFRRLIFDVTERISTELGHIFTYDCCLKNLVRTFPGTHLPFTVWGQKTVIGPTLKFDRT